MKRNCAVCGKQLKIVVNKDASYSGGRFFGVMNLGNEKAEYWECSGCYKEWAK